MFPEPLEKFFVVSSPSLYAAAIPSRNAHGDIYVTALFCWTAWDRNPKVSG